MSTGKARWNALSPSWQGVFADCIHVSSISDSVSLFPICIRMDDPPFAVMRLSWYEFWFPKCCQGAYASSLWKSNYIGKAKRWLSNSH